MSAAPAIAFHDLELGYAGRRILSGVNLQIESGRFVALLGPNGAGKTSLLRAVLGLVAPLRGQIRVLGRPARRGRGAVAYIPQRHSLNIGTHLSGRDFVASGCDGQRWGWPWLGRRARREIETALECVDAVELASRPLGELSGGQRQRLLLAQALLGKPQLLLLDEPLAGLDVLHQRQVVKQVDSIRQRLGITVLFSSHDLNPLLGSMDQVLYLAAGHAQLGSVDEVISSPVLSRLYGAHVDVVRVQKRIFVLPGAGGQAHA
ncbi:metal ABC transporter ATP-binding protein [Paludibacterium yongneupense]|uniref:metal ABC transporter ATP-binding protein n=1 Tax=Paludibacterium yongneupense TaxID=400061 RepID=UPI00040DC54A|nr:ATP-binding cassette domain-containing protein [Paludibacterium yongneupense]